MGCAGSAERTSIRSFTEQPPVPQAQETDRRLLRDKVEAETNARKPLPKGSTWLGKGGWQLEPLLAHTTLIDAAWLLKLAEGKVMPELKGVVPAWQQVPPEAIVSLEKLRYTTMTNTLPVAVLSYGWAGKSHPDRTGEQLRSLIPVLHAMVQCCKYGTSSGTPEKRPRVWGIVWDFMSLPQRGYTTGYDPNVDDRTPYQIQRFAKGLRSINIWYAEKMVTTLVLDLPMPGGAENAAPVEKRGWCIFERHLSSITKVAPCCLNLSCLKGTPSSWGDVQDLCKAARLPTLSPDAFEAMLRAGMTREEAEPGTGFRFTNGKDATSVCIPQYREGFVRLMRGAGQLAYFDCNWGDEEAALMCEAFEWAHANGATTSAYQLWLSNNNLTDVTLTRLVEVVSAGAMPELRELVLDGNSISDAGAQSLAGALSAGKLPALELLVIGGNAFGKSATATLRAACVVRGVKAMDDRKGMKHRDGKTL